MDHGTVRSLRVWLTAGAVLVAGLVGWTWADAIDDPSRWQGWFPVVLATAALVCLAVTGRRLRRQQRAAPRPGNGVGDAAERPGAERSATP
ncbi:hypothetical protein [Actinomycetospora aeridis]|uniref:Uncharacterized protein n=1 Tax=Actinomycetospora aeridis TaxID=3129231 RepID=A0ABU8NAZ0_9PSEU